MPTALSKRRVAAAAVVVAVLSRRHQREKKCFLVSISVRLIVDLPKDRIGLQSVYEFKGVCLIELQFGSWHFILRAGRTRLRYTQSISIYTCMHTFPSVIVSIVQPPTNITSHDGRF